MKGSTRRQISSYWGVSIQEEDEQSMQKLEVSNMSTWLPGMPFTPGESLISLLQGGGRIHFTCTLPKDINISIF